MRDVARHPHTTAYRKLEFLVPKFKHEIARCYIMPFILAPMNVAHRASFWPDTQFEHAQSAMAIIARQLAWRQLCLMGRASTLNKGLIDAAPNAYSIVTTINVGMRTSGWGNI